MEKMFVTVGAGWYVNENVCVCACADDGAGSHVQSIRLIMRSEGCHYGAPSLASSSLKSIVVWLLGANTRLINLSSLHTDLPPCLCKRVAGFSVFRSSLQRMLMEA